MLIYIRSGSSAIVGAKEICDHELMTLQRSIAEKLRFLIGFAGIPCWSTPATSRVWPFVMVNGIGEFYGRTCERDVSRLRC
jgi:hypothetical protein